MYSIHNVSATLILIKLPITHIFCVLKLKNSLVRKLAREFIILNTKISVEFNCVDMRIPLLYPVTLI